MTLQIRYANLPNNAKLELIKAAIPRAAAGSQVSVSLQMPDGARLKPTDFQVDASLWEVIAGFEKQEGYSLSNVIGEGKESNYLAIFCRFNETIGIINSFTVYSFD